MTSILCATNTGGIILLIAVLLFCVYSFVSLILTIVKKRKERKVLINKNDSAAQSADSNTDKEV